MLIPIRFQSRSTVTSLGRMAYYTTDNEFWNCEDSDRDLVFLHGLGGGSSAYEWSKVYPAFAPNYRIFAPDLFGWGRSDRPEREYQIEDYLITITEFIEKSCEPPVTAIASSVTAALTIRIAIDRPDLFRSLILTNPAGLSDFGEDYGRNFFAKLAATPFVDRLIYKAAIATREGISTFLEQRQFADSSRIYPEIIEAYWQSAQQPNAEYSALSFVRGNQCFDLALYLPQLTIPTAIIWGKQAQFTPSETGKRLADLNPQAVRYFQVLEDTGLTPQLEIPAITIGLIQKFLSVL
ncbi:MAG TPA: alpha/beta hydrolase [Oscillatoriales cyanobacterium M59_W2019_021]|nr:MAG: alpha/beta hydrolase [Cyanobacteria bacterium J055]HIK32726.1 alpha/beta hydrolase [Oscillatoriales cyanobacterium M4454_W2019_049]HIK50166.1 alpha/beta hydrolase [Oscillatoriales cyanobacterium M59_W2019_021]